MKTGSERSLSSGAAEDTVYRGLAYINTASMRERNEKGQKQKKKKATKLHLGIFGVASSNDV